MNNKQTSANQRKYSNEQMNVIKNIFFFIVCKTPLTALIIIFEAML